MSSMTAERLQIAHPELDGGAIAGILEHRGPAVSDTPRPIALILHGVMGHKDYVYQKRLAQRLPLDSYRFDFRGNHETPGAWRFDGLARDVADIAVVEAALRARGYAVALLVGHSRGSVAAMHWLATAPQGTAVRGLVNCAGRYRMEKIYANLPKYQPAFDAQGFYEWKLTVARAPVVGVIRPEHVRAFAHWDTSVVSRAPAGTHVLTVHGLADTTVPPYDALIYARVFGARPPPGTHTLHLLEDAVHNFAGCRDEVADAIVAWWAALERGALVTGVWDGGPAARAESSKL